MVLCVLYYVCFYGVYEVFFECLLFEWWIVVINVCDEEVEFIDKDGNVIIEVCYIINGSFIFIIKFFDVLN